MMGSGDGGGVSSFDEWQFSGNGGRRYLNGIAHGGLKDKMNYKSRLDDEDRWRRGERGSRLDEEEDKNGR